MSKTTNTTEGQTPITSKSIHKQLQAIAAGELAKIPEYLEQLTPAERVRFVLSILPYTAPRVATCETHFGEGLASAWDID